MNVTLRTVLIAFLAILAVSVAASTLDSSIDTSMNDRLEADGAGSGGSQGDGDGGLAPPATSPPPGETIRIPFLTELFSLVALLAAIALIVYVLLYWRETLGILLALGAFLVIVYILAQFIPIQPTVPMESLLGTGGDGSLGVGGSGTESEPVASPPPRIALVMLGLFLLAVILVLYRRGRTVSTNATELTATDNSETAKAVGRAAGRAAERMEAEASVENEVYRAWREMTELLDVDRPHSTTPGEFATAAIEAGLGKEDVRELTALFEQVRYGSVTPSDEYEKRATAVFERIESRYGGTDR